MLHSFAEAWSLFVYRFSDVFRRSVLFLDKRKLSHGSQPCDVKRRVEIFVQKILPDLDIGRRSIIVSQSVRTYYPHRPSFIYYEQI